MSGHIYTLFSVAFGPNLNILASGSGDETIKIWNVNNGSQIRQLKGHSDYIRSVAFSPNGKMLASGSDDCIIKIWNI